MKPLLVEFKEDEKKKSTNTRYHFVTAQFNLSDTAQYYQSVDNFLEHVKLSDHAISTLANSTDQMCFGPLILGNLCTLVANQYAYFLLNREAAGHPRLNIKLTSRQRAMLGLVVLLSILNKSFAASSSFSALEIDYDRPSIGIYINFVLAFLSHCLAQSSVQGVSGDWHAGCNKTLAKIVAAISAGYYTVSLLALNYNGIDNACISFGWLDHRPRMDSREGIIKLIVIAPFFIASLLRTPVVYYNRKVGRLLSKEDAQQRDEEEAAKQRYKRGSCCQKFQKVIGGLASVQRSGNMLLSLSAILYGVTHEKWVAISMAVAGSALTVWGTLKSNAAVMYPRANFMLRFLLDPQGSTSINYDNNARTVYDMT